MGKAWLLLSDAGHIRWLEVLRIPELPNLAHLETRRMRQGEGTSRRPRLLGAELG